MKVSHFLLASLLVLLLSACGGTDLALINQVKSFEPNWMNLGDQVSFLDRNLRLAQRNYSEDFEEVDPLISHPATVQRNRLHGLRSQYMNVMIRRDSLASEFQKEKKRFISEINSFNEWESRLMQDKISNRDAHEQLLAFQESLGEMEETFDDLQNEVIRNIEEHNSIFRRLSTSLRLYSNFDVHPR
ncbi:MAG: hypothetical protein AAF206_04600 [Bacteroidota bacterium]